jgi:hypothetical protein
VYQLLFLSLEKEFLRLLDFMLFLSKAHTIG